MRQTQRAGALTLDGVAVVAERALVALVTAVVVLVGAVGAEFRQQRAAQTVVASPAELVLRRRRAVATVTVVARVAQPVRQYIAIAW